MTNDFGVNYESYEVNKDYSEVNKKLSRLLKLNHLLKVYTISMNLKSLLNMKEHDLHINLNVYIMLGLFLIKIYKFSK